MSLRAWLLLLLLSTIFSSTFYFQAVALRELDVFNVVLWRVAIGGASLTLFCLLSGRALGWRQRWRSYAILGATNNAVPFSLIVFAQQYIESGLAAVLNTSAPFFAILLAHFMTRDEPVSWRKLGGVGLGTCGVAVLMGILGTPVEPGVFIGGPAVLLAGLSYAFSGVFGKRLDTDSPYASSAGMLCAAAGLIALAVLVSGEGFQLPHSPAVWGAVLGLGVLCAALVFPLYFALLRLAGAVNLLLLALLLPVGANLLGVWLLAETLTPQELLGMGIIALGLGVVDGRMLRLLQPRR